MASFSERIDELCIRNGLSYQGFADRVNEHGGDDGARLSKSFVADVINGKREPRYKTIVKIAAAFNVSTDYLLGLTDTDATLHEDENTAMQTTGLSATCIKQLHDLSDNYDHFSEYAELIALLVDDLHHDYKTQERLDAGDGEGYGYAFGTVLDAMREVYAFNFLTLIEDGFKGYFGLTMQGIVNGKYKDHDVVNADGSLFEIESSIIKDYLKKQCLDFVVDAVEAWALDKHMKERKAAGGQKGAKHGKRKKA